MKKFKSEVTLGPKPVLFMESLMKTKSDPTLVVLHEYGAPEHTTGLVHWASANGMKVCYREFDFPKQVLRAVYRRDFDLMCRALRNAFWLCLCIFGFIRDRRIVVGIAPFDWKLVLLLPFLRRNEVWWHTSWPHWGGWLREKKYPKPIRFGVVEAVWRRFIKDHLKGIYFVTDFGRSRFLKAFGASIPSAVVHHSIDQEIFFSHPKCRERRLRVGFVGRVAVSKGIREFIALSNLEFKAPIQFAVAGGGPLMEEVEIAARASGGRLVYEGYLGRKKLAEFYRSIDFLLVPSKRMKDWEEAFGMVIVEAMACGVVPIATDHPGPMEILGRKLPGNLLTESGFVEGAKAIIDRAATDLENYEQMQSICLRLSESYALSSIAERWNELQGPTLRAGTNIKG